MTTPQPPYQPGPPQQPYNAYPLQGQYPPQHPMNMPATLTAPKKLKKWPWIVGGIILVFILAVGGCMAAFAGAVNAVDEARKGGSVNLGETYKYASGVSVSASVPGPDDPGEPVHRLPRGDRLPVHGHRGERDGQARRGGARHDQRHGELSTGRAVRRRREHRHPGHAPGQSLAIPFKFNVKKGTTGPLQIAVTADINEPVFFNGKLG